MKQITRKLFEEIRYKRKMMNASTEDIIRNLFDEGFEEEQIVKIMKMSGFKVNDTKEILKYTFGLDPDVIDEL